MKKFNFVKAVGLVVWGVLALATWGAITLNILGSVWLQIAIVAFAGLLSLLASYATDAGSMGQALGYGLTFVMVGLVVDLLVTYSLIMAGVFTMWAYWASYLAILLAPTIPMISATEVSSGAHAHQ